MIEAFDTSVNNFAQVSSHPIMVKRRFYLFAAGLLLLSAASVAAALALAPGGARAARIPPEPGGDRPNVVVIETDDQTSEQLRVLKKTLRLIGREGATFESSFVSFSLCCPSRATLLTGQYAHNHRVLANGPPNGGYPALDHKRTLAVWLRRAGYSTAFVGKFLNGYQARRLQIPPGWSRWYAATSLSYFNYTINENGTLHYYGSEPADYQTDVFTRKAKDVINSLSFRGRPFFLWVSYFAPHAGGPPDKDDPPGFGATTPHPAPKYANAFAREPLPRPPGFNEADLSDKPAWMRNRSPLTAQKIAGVREVYQQQLESLLSVDDGVEKIVDALRANDQLDNTVIIFTDDNGFFHGEHRLTSGKALVYEPAIRVPLLMRGPGIRPGIRPRQMVWNGDLAPTILNLAHARHQGRVLDGRSLLPLLRDPDKRWGRDLLVERPPGALKGVSESAPDPAFTAIRTPRFLYAEYRSGDRELYDLVRDPGETQSLHTNGAYAALRTELHRRLAGLRHCRGEACRTGPRTGLRVLFDTRRSGKKVCTSSDVVARLSGADRRWISQASFFLNGRLRWTGRKRPFAAVVPQSDLPRSASRIRVSLSFVDGRVVERTERIPSRCG